MFGHAHHQAVFCYAGVVDEYVDAAEVLDYFFHYFLCLVEIGCIGGIAFAFHAECFDFGFGGFAVFVNYKVGKSDICTLLCESHGDGTADAACGTGDKGCFSFEKFHFLRIGL